MCHDHNTYFQNSAYCKHNMKAINVYICDPILFLRSRRTGKNNEEFLLCTNEFSVRITLLPMLITRALVLQGCIFSALFTVKKNSHSKYLKD